MNVSWLVSYRPLATMLLLPKFGSYASNFALLQQFYIPRHRWNRPEHGCRRGSKMEATPAQAGDDADAAAVTTEVTTPLDAALPLILPFTSLQCKGRAQATSKIVRESVVVDELDARPLYSKLGAAKATALLPSLLEKHRLVSLNLEFCRAASILDAVAETQHATLKH